MFRRKKKELAKFEIPSSVEGFGIVLTLYPKGRVEWSSYGGLHPFYGVAFPNGEHFYPNK